MPQTYTCPHCSAPIVTFMRAGEWAACAACRAASRVPSEAHDTDARAEWIASPSPPQASGAAAQPRVVTVRSSTTRPFLAGMAVGCGVAMLGVVGLVWWGYHVAMKSLAGGDAK